MTDTDPRAQAIQLDLLRRMTPGERAAAAFNLTELVLALAEAGVRKQYPEASDQEVFLRVAARHLDRELMIRVYGWDPLAA